MVPGLSDDNLRSSIRQIYVENHLKSSRKWIKKLSLNLRGVCLIQVHVCSEEAYASKSGRTPTS